jgi:hypothetical protein
MAVPEASVDEDGQAQAADVNIRLPRQVIAMKTVADTTS